MDANARTHTSLQVEAVKILADGTRVPLGTIAYWHKNPLRRLWWRIKSAILRKGV